VEYDGAQQDYLVEVEEEVGVEDESSLRCVVWRRKSRSCGQEVRMKDEVDDGLGGCPSFGGRGVECMQSLKAEQISEKPCNLTTNAQSDATNEP
jgi:hypothetical protein